ncbi:MAG: glycine cleavage system protein GcvH [Dehalococcoidia bacterium]
MDVPDQLLYTDSDEWVRIEGGASGDAGDEVVIGITDYAQDQLGDIVFVELPPVGRALTAGVAFGVVESIKAVSDLNAPVTGEVLEVNESLADAPEQVNADPYGAGWFLRVRLGVPLDRSALLTAEAYRAFRLDGGS